MPRCLAITFAVAVLSATGPTACNTTEPVDAEDIGVDDDATATQDTGSDAEEDADVPVVELQVDTVSPNEGAVDGGTEVTLGGQGFEENMTVYFGDSEAEEVERMGGLSATAITPPGDAEGTVDVTVQNPDGEQATVADAFHYVDEDEPPPPPPPEGPEACGVQFPIIAEALSLADDDEVTVYGRIFEPDVTDRAELSDDLVAQALVAPAGTGPDDFDEYAVIDAERNPEYVDDDFEEFEATIAIDADASSDEAISFADTWTYVFRFSLDGGDHWTVCDITGFVDDEAPDPTRFAALNIFDETQDVVHFCATWPDELTGSSDGDGPTVDMEVYEDGVTDDADGFDDTLIEVEAGFGPPGANPALGYEWTPLDYQGQVDGNDNNAHYAGPLYDADDAPDAGDYEALTRARPEGEEAWRYCNTDDGVSDFLLELVTEVSVEP